MLKKRKKHFESMWPFSSGKNKEKTLEEKAKEFGIALRMPSGIDYSSSIIKGAGESPGAAENKLLEYAKSGGMEYLYNISKPELRSSVYVKGTRVNTYLIFATGYTKKKSDTA